MKEFIFVMTMWGIDGAGTENYIGQVALQQPFTEQQCEKLMDESMWNPSYENEYYFMRGHCFPAECAGKEQCSE